MQNSMCVICALSASRFLGSSIEFNACVGGISQSNSMLSFSTTISDGEERNGLVQRRGSVTRHSEEYEA